jgi:iron(III) transport system ATP-binding protein
MKLATRPGQVSLHNVSKLFGLVVAVDSVTLEIAAGTLVTLLGPSGCGKTTTLRMIAGLEIPTSGRIMIGGKDVTMLPANERDVSMVFQSYALFPHMTVIENVAYGLAGSGVSARAQIEKAQEGLRLVGLAGYDGRLPSELSGGQQQRVACARALVLEPQVLLFDEPLSNLDAKLRRRMREEIRDIQQNLGLTAIYVTHDQVEALAVSDRIVVMNQGRIAQNGTPVELYRSPADAFVADFIGGANLLPCRIAGPDGAGKVNVELGGSMIAVTDQGYHGGETLLVVRPGSVVLTRNSGGDQGLPATVRKATYLGSHWEFTLDTEVGAIFVTQPVDRRFEPGEAVALKLDPDQLTIVSEAAVHREADPLPTP